jgi:hypothetical protein
MLNGRKAVKFATWIHMDERDTLHPKCVPHLTNMNTGSLEIKAIQPMISGMLDNGNFYSIIYKKSESTSHPSWRGIYTGATLRLPLPLKHNGEVT